MSKTLVTQIIREARSLVADPDHWTQFELATTAGGEDCDPWDPKATAFCAFGALIKAAYGMSNDSRLAMRFAHSASAAMLGNETGNPGGDQRRGGAGSRAGAFRSGA
jgi:hypothetical protein